MKNKSMLYLISVIVIVLFLLVFVYFFRRQRKEDLITAGVFPRLTSGIQDIGFIEMYKGPYQRKISVEFVGLAALQRVFKFSDSDDYWIEFVLENTATSSHNFSMKEVSWCREGYCIKADLTLLMERVPEYMSPPDGRRYFDTAVYRNFILGPKGPKSFTFYCRFKLPESFVGSIKGSDILSLTLEMNKTELHTGKNIGKDQIVLQDMLQYARFRNIQCIDAASETIRWEG